MRIGVDARFLTHPQAGGFKTYTRQLIGALARIDADNEYILYTDRPARPLPLPENFHVCAVPLRGGALAMPLREQVYLPARARSDRVDVFHAPAATAPLSLACPSVVTVHDTILFEAPRAVPRRALAEVYERFVIRRAARRAAAVLTVSESARARVLRALRLAAERIVVTREAAGAEFRVVPTAETARRVRALFGLTGAFVLGLDSSDPRKNISALVAAHGLLPRALREDFALVLAGGGVRAAARRSAARILGPVSDQQLCLLYNAAALFVFPSLDEGFGLPPLEAMACGTPVIVGRTPAVIEVVGAAAEVADCARPEALAAALEQMLTDGDRRAAHRQRGLERAREFSWERCARATLGVYQRAARPRASP